MQICYIMLALHIDKVVQQMKGRSYGIDLLKSVSMLMIVMLHILGIGGILDATVQGSGGFYTAWLMEALNICAVNCFGLVSGYVLTSGRYRGSRLLSLWIRVVAEGLLITLVFWLIMPDKVGKWELLNALLPVTRQVYWYFTAYFALFFFVPYINRMLHSLRQTELYRLGIIIVIFATVVGNVGMGDIYHFSGGYSFLWLLCLYILGGILRTIPVNKKINMLWFLLAFVLSAVLAVVGMLITGNKNFVWYYTSPLILSAATALLLFFRRLQFSGRGAQKFISMLARTSFGVYIIHTHPLPWTFLILGSFAVFARLPPPVMVLCVIGSAGVIYSLCTAADWLVEKLLKLLGVEKLAAKFDDFMCYLTKSVQKPQKAAHK